ncbi:MAG: hypothetical protein L0Z52_04945 [Acidobacteria bacterium]|nr:hypothetical protein [Acidobacteriota bacterium]
MKMSKIHVHNLRSLENSPTSPARLRTKIGEVILHSAIARAKVEALNPETGEYRVVLQGTLDRDEFEFES